MLASILLSYFYGYVYSYNSVRPSILFRSAIVFFSTINPFVVSRCMMSLVNITSSVCKHGTWGVKDLIFVLHLKIYCSILQSWSWNMLWYAFCWNGPNLLQSRYESFLVFSSVVIEPKISLNKMNFWWQGLWTWGIIWCKFSVFLLKK